ncbi:hypothetical protein ACIA5D_00015 [Actinoplanes sp. NPDC051513]|uniref:hypothetical protein n=1 Tax=Actinoplanes sp. NPDC051513 TaxID=3363908 RepID=UPI0037A93F1A
MCSAFAHGDEWPSLALLSTPDGPDVDGIVPLKVQTPTSLAAVSFGLATRMVQHAITLYDSRRRSPY